ncbi:outer membrane protein [Tropicimonas sp. IMCC34043]|uniref:outer membrane protein n=1 Tax=Tropicimonas sp. IMCC34043 TaxID=2248760 RepID=UPI001300BA73|nr:outer membrane beta-barrel protein [Tropicimonas sp. IMCC34043]
MFRTSIPVVALVLAGPAVAQDSQWSFEASLYGWLPGASTTADTRFGTVESDTSGSDALSNLDMAFMGTFQARNGRWGVIGDLLYVDLGQSADSPLNLRFRDADVNLSMTAFSGYVTYRVHEENGVGVDIAGGFRYFDATLDTTLNSADARPDIHLDGSESWAVPLIGARAIVPFNDKWFGTGFADFGGTGNNDQTWQAFASVGYKFDERWSTQLGYRFMSVEKELDNADTTIDLSGLLLGVSVTF